MFESFCLDAGWKVFGARKHKSTGTCREVLAAMSLSFGCFLGESFPAALLSNECEYPAGVLEFFRVTSLYPFN